MRGHKGVQANLTHGRYPTKRPRAPSDPVLPDAAAQEVVERVRSPLKKSGNVVTPGVILGRLADDFVREQSGLAPLGHMPASDEIDKSQWLSIS